jgi:hypothetical protein
VHLVRSVLAGRAAFSAAVSSCFAYLNTVAADRNHDERFVCVHRRSPVSSGAVAWLEKVPVRFLMGETFGQK